MSDKVITMLRPKEVLEKDPTIKKYFSANELGTLLKMNLVRGKKLLRGSLVCYEDVLRVVDFRKSSP